MVPLAFRFYHMKKEIDAENVKVGRKTLPFQTKFEQAVEMLSNVPASFSASPVWVVTDSWFRNDCTPTCCYAVNHRKHFAFSDIRKLIIQVALDKDFGSLCPKPGKPTQNSFIATLLRMVA